jgi:hypothetical protein
VLYINCLWLCRALQVLAIFAAAPELCELLRGVEADYARFLQHRRPEGAHAEVLPFLAEQAQEWEAAATATSSTSPQSSVCALLFLCRGLCHIYDQIIKGRMSKDHVGKGARHRVHIKCALPCQA